MIYYAYNDSDPVIYSPTYAAQNRILLTSFDALTNDKFYGQYIMNAFTFSCVKEQAKMLQLQQEIFDSKGVRRGFSEFKKVVKPIIETYNRHLITEYNQAVRGAVMIEEWNALQKDKDIFPYAIYRTRRDPRVRDEHAVLEGLKFKIDSDLASNLFPPNGWNCRCWWESTNNESKILDEKEIEKELNRKVKGKYTVPENFRFNVGNIGVFPQENSYTQISQPVNKLNKSDYTGRKTSTTKLNYKRANYSQYFSVFGQEFENKELKLKIYITNEIKEKLSKKAYGLENLKTTIEKSSEVWGLWRDEKNQKGVNFRFILFDNDHFYEVLTIDNQVIDFNLKRYKENTVQQRGVKLLI